MEEHPVQIPAINLTSTDPAIPGWHRETTFLRDYPSDKDSVIFIIGAFNGTIAALMLLEKPDARYYLFEPQDWAAEQLRGKFGDKPNVKVCEFALGDRNGKFQMARYGSDFCTFIRGSQPLTPGAEGYFDAQMREFGSFVEEEGIEAIFHASINIEHYEYVLIPYLEQIGWLSRIDTLGISWHALEEGHRFLDGDPITFDETEYGLKEGHEVVLSIDNWQSWARKAESEEAPEETTEPEKGEVQGEEVQRVAVGELGELGKVATEAEVPTLPKKRGRPKKVAEAPETSSDSDNPLI